MSENVSDFGQIIGQIIGQVRFFQTDDLQMKMQRVDLSDSDTLSDLSDPLRDLYTPTGYIVPRVPTDPGLGAGPRSPVGRGAVGADGAEQCA